MTDITEHYYAVMKSPYPSTADKEHVKAILKRYDRMKRSRDKLRALLNGQTHEEADPQPQKK